MQASTEGQCGAQREAGGTEEQDGGQARRDKGASGLTLRYQPLSSPSEYRNVIPVNICVTIALTTCNFTFTRKNNISLYS